MSKGPQTRRPDGSFKFYGRKRGVRLSARQERLVDTLLNDVRFKPDTALNDPAFLEIGFGGGEHLARLAARHPDASVVGAEPFVNGVAKLLVQIEEQDLNNVSIFDDDVRLLFDQLGGALFDRIYLLYPDPWPKSRHHKRRLVNPENLGHIHRLLKPEGLFVFASDIPDYVEWTLEAVSRHGGFTATHTDPSEPPAHWQSTRYEQKALREGRTPAYLVFKRQS